MEELVEILGCRQLSLHLKYLGLPLGATHKEETIWNLVLEKIERRLARWKMMYLSKGGKVTLIKNTLSSLPTFFLSLCPIPVKVANYMEKLQRDFLWSGIDALKIPLVEWAKVCMSMHNGGLGIWWLRIFNSALLGKIVMEIWNGERCPLEEGYWGKIWGWREWLVHQNGVRD